MTDRTVHVVGGGLAGLSAAVRLAEGGVHVALYEAARHAGGRCRSYHDPALDLMIDNGNHLLLSGNAAALDYVDRIGARGALVGEDETRFLFADLATGARWTIHPNDGRFAWWIFVKHRRVPGTRPSDYLSVLRLFVASSSATMAEAMRCSGSLYERLWRPLFLAALNTEPREASASLAARVVRETLLRGGMAYRPLVAAHGLAPALVDPALVHLSARGADVRLGARLQALRCEEGAVRALSFGDTDVILGPDDGVVMAVPPGVACGFLPDLEVPDDFRGIVNAHFRVAPPPDWPLVLGVINGLSEWLFAFPNRLSVTISAADRLMDSSREELAAAIWGEISGLTGLARQLPPWQIVRERRATFAATPAQAGRRPSALTRYPNLVLAGDWTATGLPGTIEGAVRSGYKAAAIISRRDRSKAL